jgi:ABC-type glutathione transport system ATPase component
MLRTENLWVEKSTAAGPVPVLRGISLAVPSGQVTVLLGESGAGKTILARALSGLLPDGMRVGGGRILFRGRELDRPGAWDALRGREIFYAPQNAAACLNPVLTIGCQIRECCRIGRDDLDALLVRLRFSDPQRILRSYSFALSGGECQRCLLAMALACCAEMLILDEPTSEIDATAQEEFIRVLLDYQRDRSLTVLLISHHLGFVQGIAHNLCVMSRGELLAAGTPSSVLASPHHAYMREIAAYLAAT